MFMHNIWLIPLLPFIGAFINGIIGRKKFSKSMVSAVAVTSTLLSFILMILAVYQLAGLPEEARNVPVKLFEWINVGNAHISNGLMSTFNVAWEFKLDPLSSVMGLIVTGVGFLIHIYSVGYMSEDPSYARYFSYLNLFMGSMLILVLGGNYLMMFIGWEGVGLCSYLLIGFFFDKKFAADAGKKAFIVNRIGDFGFAIGLMFIFVLFGSLNFDQVAARATEVYATGFHFAGWNFSGVMVFNIIGLCLFVGATGKSAQIPLYVWLPDAMAGPTPVSALIHAATMVTSGLYMIARSSAIFSGAPLALMIVGLIGAVTAIFAAVMGMAQNDIKKVLAYSTVSQLGYMFMAMGAAAYWAGIFHVMTHAFFKACLFLGAGSVIHAMHHAYHKTHNNNDPQDMKNMGGLRKFMPKTFWTFAIATIAIAGIPGFSGFFSKDEILWKTVERALVYGDKVYWLYWGLGAVAAGLTAFYMSRAVFMTFFGEFKGTKEEEKALHESPGSMTWPLIILASLAVVGGYLGFPHLLGQYLGHFPNILEKWLEPVLVEPRFLKHGVEHASQAVEFGFMGISIAIAISGIAIGWLFYIKNPELPKKFVATFKGMHHTVYNKFFVDEVYEAIFISGIKKLGHYFWAFDVWVVDGFVNGARHLTLVISEVSAFFDGLVVDGLVNLVGKIVDGTGYIFRRLQTGFVQSYAFMMVIGFIVLISYYIFR